jgi:rhodanese-related sulfurtransferase
MKKLFALAIVALMPLTGVVAHAEGTAAEKFQLIHVPELQKQLADKAHPVYLYDANNKDTRTSDGIIPGAKLLANSTHYEVAVLPASKDANVVFYCANTECTASHSAAKRAIEAGYKNVSVFADGIEGWKKAGLKTDKI